MPCGNERYPHQCGFVLVGEAPQATADPFVAKGPQVEPCCPRPPQAHPHHVSGRLTDLTLSRSSQQFGRKRCLLLLLTEARRQHFLHHFVLLTNQIRCLLATSKLLPDLSVLLLFLLFDTVVAIDVVRLAWGSGDTECQVAPLP
jgi:hypothetical protein